MKRLFTTTAIALLMTGAPAMAQTDQQQPESNGSQTQMQQNQQNQQDMQGQQGQSGGSGYGSGEQQTGQQTGQDSDMQSDKKAQTGAEKQDKQKQAQTGGGLQKETRASNLIGTSVANASGETIGEISDILFGQDGNADKVLIGVGGFLGIGQKNVAVEFSELDFSRDENNNLTVTTSITAESLEQMPAYEDQSGMGQEGQGSQGSGGTGMQQDGQSGQTGGQSGQSGNQL